MKFISILAALSLILIFSCDEDPPENNNTQDGTTGGSDGGTSGGGTSGGGWEPEIDDSICDDCIWLQDDCNGGWFIGYNISSSFRGFQFNIEGANFLSVSGGAAAEANFQISVGNSMVIGFSASSGIIDAGSGILTNIVFDGSPHLIPTEIIEIIFSNEDAISLNITFHDNLISCYHSTLENTGESQLVILLDSITSLSPGDEIGIFDLNGIKNYNDCSNQIGELLVGTGVWTGDANEEGTVLSLVSIGSIDLCAFGGVQLAGFVEGNPLIIKVYRPTSGLEYSTQVSWREGTGYFGDIFQTISAINLTNPLPKRSF